MKLEDLHEEIIWEDDEIKLVLVEARTRLSPQLTLKGKSGRLIKDIDALAKKGIQKAGVIGVYALDHLKRYKKMKHNLTRTIAFYARNVQERRAYERVIKTLTKGKEYKVVRTFPYPGGGRMWELKRK